MKRYFIILAFLIFGISIYAEIPRNISYQGILTDSDTGDPLTGTVTLTIRLYTQGFCDDTDITNAVWEETHENVQLTNGVFNIILGTITALDEHTVTFDQPYCLGITIGEGTELADRLPLTSSPYSLNPQEFPVPLHLSGTFTVPVIMGTNHGIGYGVAGINTSVSSEGYLGYTSGWFHDKGIGVIGKNTVCSYTGMLGTEYEGVYGEDESTGTYGALASYSVGVLGGNKPTNNYGSLGSENDGVYGEFDENGNYGQLGTWLEGVYGENGISGNYGRIATEFHGIYGEESTTGNYGTLGSQHDGVYGRFEATDNWGQIGCEFEAVYGKNTQADEDDSNDFYGLIAGKYNDNSMYSIYGKNINIDAYGYIAGQDEYGRSWCIWRTLRGFFRVFLSALAMVS